MPSARRVIDHDTALTAARRRFVATGGLPMDEVCRDLNVSRATLYRVVGSRDLLLGDVLWQLARRTLDMAVHETRGAGASGVELLLGTADRFERAVARFAPVQRLLREEPVDALRVLFTGSGRVHERMVDAWAGLLREARRSGELAELPFGVDESAYALVRVGESMLYGDLLAGVVPDGELAERLRRTILCAG
ncbi:hypothetical protein SRB5_05780 [Streptomyces sp. RB5]|uniref:QsdR TetR regulatory C-terminal domain-containing protein n=1 Tax=Streptomyces smaragdinus TaxID=2585196 RepID=A0A7K0CAJ2_9ACTN|nr:QsdR family transcriptional regulator [Streptomyces smaragdinus]MQY10470.1 hypothetical protein [Streptomyces smaragdinus]